ncbi:15552_t:CDS:2 [Dentiscutata erythropus]|uniref:15552_t:CDS:1 n=1 Tax=Dentiscutata erythropus TaxID=1348616 RepID=A0A9N9GBE0_9GLOM|nr:15552_t:CDS:2 [Dentiscutata erythropus]
MYLKYHHFIVIILCVILIVSETNATSYAVDAGDPHGVQAVSAWSCAKASGFTRAIIECYSEYCSQGGGVSSSCLGNYKNAVAAGYKYIDLYFYPCTGAAYNCKSPQTQVNELVTFVNQNKMLVQTIWIDFENDTTTCTKSWSQDTASNLALAKQFTNAAKTTLWNWGIYSTNYEWTKLFGSAQAVVDSSFKIWYADFQNPSQPNYDDWNSLAFGGFSTPSGKQYADSGSNCGIYDLSIFTYSTGAQE